MVSAACPNCNILLVEANDNSTGNLGQAVNTAVAMGAFAVSNSYGGLGHELRHDLRLHYYNHPGVVITALSGDCGYNCTGNSRPTPTSASSIRPASQYVVAVGGTKLAPASNARGWTESAWGSIAARAEPAAVLGVRVQALLAGGRRVLAPNVADVSAVADPNPGVWTSFERRLVWHFGGTSAASPIIAATYALAGGDGRHLSGELSLQRRRRPPRRGRREQR